jgi:hypothetical protein
MDEGYVGQHQVQIAQQRERAGFTQLSDRGEVITNEKGSSSSDGDGDSSSAGGSDDSSEISDYDYTLDGTSVLSADDVGGQKIWLAPVDVHTDE